MTAPGFRSTMAGMSPAARLALSEQVISGWENMGKPGGAISDTMRMIGEELAELRSVAARDPSLAERVAVISERYGRMALKVKLSAN